ncbi:MAG TPA: lysylphosphatidylglycerol synthase domain-containing protein [Solirubrobacteraceae bacterium]|nr:lysylphosphatidylglycerol synthase domain-containing protein [Solirubrobacteraceae bacterium]
MRRGRTLTIVGSLIAGMALLVVLAGKRHQLLASLHSASLWVLAGAALLQIVALVARSEAWHRTIAAAGGTIDRRVLFRASSMQVLGGVVNSQLGVAARIAALRRSAPGGCPQVATLVAAELPILIVEAALAALASFTLIGPLGLPWWAPALAIGLVGGVGIGLRRLAIRKGRELWEGLAVLRTPGRGGVVVAFVLVAVLAQIARNWMLLHAVGVDASVLEAIAVLIAVVTLGQLPVGLGPGIGAASAVLILGHGGVAATAAAGVLMTATGTVGGLCFAGWAGGDRLLCRSGLLRRRFA